MSSPEVSPFVPRGPVAHAIHSLRLSVILLIVVVVISNALQGFFQIRSAEKVKGTAATLARVQKSIADLQTENATLKATAAENQRATDARALAGTQALALLVQQVSQIHTLNPDQIQAVLGAINAAIDTTTQNLKKQGVPVTPIPKVTLSPAPPKSPGAKTQGAPRCPGIQVAPLDAVQVCIPPPH